MDEYLSTPTLQLSRRQTKTRPLVMSQRFQTPRSHIRSPIYFKQGLDNRGMQGFQYELPGYTAIRFPYNILAATSNHEGAR